MKPQWISDWEIGLRECKNRADNPFKMWEGDALNPLGVLCVQHGFVEKNTSQLSNYAKLYYVQWAIANSTNTNPSVDFLASHVYGTKWGTDTIEINYFGEYKAHVMLMCIPIALTSKLNCNSPLMFLGNKKPSVYINDKFLEHSSIHGLIGGGISFEMIADIISDWWPLLTFNDNGGKENLVSKTYIDGDMEIRFVF